MSAADGAVPRVECDEAPRVRLPVVQPTDSPRLVDMLHARSGRLVVIARARASARGLAQWLCRCDCGETVVILGAKLRGDRPRKSCGQCKRVQVKTAAPGPRKREQRRRTGARPKTLSMRRQSKKELARMRVEFPVHEHALYQRPTTRRDCLAGGINAARPCPFASCSHHLAVEVNARNGNIKLNFPDVDVADMVETCSLDVADRGGITLEELGAVTNLTRERIRQLEDAALDAIKRIPMMRALADVEHTDSRGQVADADDGSGARTDREAIDGLWDAGGATRLGGWM